VDTVNVTDVDGSTRVRLLTVAGEVVVDSGVEGVSLREIARRAGVSHNAPLRHFPTLANLLAHVSADGFGRLTAELDDAVAAAGRRVSPRRRLVAGLRAYCEFAIANPGPFALMFRFDLVDRDEPQLAKTSHEAFDRLLELVAAAQSDGWQPSIQPGLAAGAVWSAVHGLVSLWLDEAIQPSTSATRLDQLLAPLLSMLVPTTARRPR
jgi:AcrR family transcriptional regulator